MQVADGQCNPAAVVPSFMIDISQLGIGGPLAGFAVPNAIVNSSSAPVFEKTKDCVQRLSPRSLKYDRQMYTSFPAAIVPPPGLSVTVAAETLGVGMKVGN